MAGLPATLAKGIRKRSGDKAKDHLQKTLTRQRVFVK